MSIISTHSSLGNPLYFVKLIPKGTKGVRVDLTNRVESFEFEDNESKADKLKLTVDNWDLANLDTPVWRKGGILEVTWGYPGRLAPARQVIIKKVTGFTTLSVEGFSKKFLMDRVDRCRVFENKKRSDMVKQIAEENGFSDEVQFIQDTKEIVEFQTQAKQTDAHFIRRLAQKEGFEFYVDFDGLHFHERQVGQKPVRTFRWYAGGASPGNREAAILSFNIDNDTSPIPGRTTTRGRDHKKKIDFEFIVDYTKDFSPQLAPNAEVTAGLLTGLANVASDVIDVTSEALASLGLRRARGRGKKRRHLTVKAKMTILGDPEFLAKTVCGIEGIGNRLSGNYYLRKITHKIAGSGYECACEILRDGHKENRKQERLFAFVPGRGGGGGGGSTCLSTLKQVQLQIDDFVDTRDQVFIEIHKLGVPIGGALSQFLGQRIRTLKTLRPKVTENPKANTLTIPVLDDIQSTAIEVANNETLVLSAGGRLGLGRIRIAARSLASSADRAKRICLTEEADRAGQFNSQKELNRRGAGNQQTEAERLERQRLQQNRVLESRKFDRNFVTYRDRRKREVNALRESLSDGD